MKHRSQRHKRWKRQLKNSCGFGWYKREEIWFGKHGKWLKARNKGKKDTSYEQDNQGD